MTDFNAAWGGQMLNTDKSLWENSGEISFLGVANLEPGTRIVNSGKLEIGDNFCVNAASNIICYKKIRLVKMF